MAIFRFVYDPPSFHAFACGNGRVNLEKDKLLLLGYVAGSISVCHSSSIHLGNFNWVK